VRAGRSPGATRAAILAALLVLTTAAWAPAAAVAPPSGPAPASAGTPAAASTPYIQHVVVVVLENEILPNVWGHGPYERYLAAQYGNATNYYAVCHPSAPNYLVMFAAVANQCGSDTWNNYTNTSINVELDAANLTWAAYAESLPSGACGDPGSATAGMFATRHVPALWFSNILKNQTYCNDHVLSSASFNDSVANGTLPNYSYYTPNLCDDGHNGCGGNTTDAQMTAQADAWLDGWLSPILNHTGRYASSAEQAVVNHTAFFLTWDEGTGSNSGFAVPGITGGDNYKWCGQNGASGDAVCGGQIYTAVVSPYSKHTTFATNDSPYGLLRTVEWLFHLAPLGNPGGFDNQSGFPAMTSLFQFPGPSFNVTARQSGLPANTTWWFNVTGAPPASTIGMNLTLGLPNGSYTYVAAVSGPGWSSPNGSFVVNGTSLNLSVAFSAGKFPVTFVESGLVPKTWWRLTVSGVPQPGSSNGSVVVNLTDGRHTYAATTNNSTWSSPNGTFAVVGGPLQVNVTFARVVFAATVTAAGLPSTIDWWLNISQGPQTTGAGPNLSVSLPNGSYTFTAQAAGNTWSRTGGALDVSGGPAGATVDFALVVYTVTFRAQNLSSSLGWNLTFEGASRAVVAGGSTAYTEPNGTYAYGATGPTNAPALRPNGTFLVSGGPENVTVSFDPTLVISAFAATPANVSLGATLAIRGTVSGGTSPYSVHYRGLPPGCTPSTSASLSCVPSESGTYTVVLEVTDAVGATTSATATVVVGAASTSTAGGPASYLGLEVGVALIVVAALAVGLILLGRRRQPPT
jgi:hypothetical protein